MKHLYQHLEKLITFVNADRENERAVIFLTLLDLLSQYHDGVQDQPELEALRLDIFRGLSLINVQETEPLVFPIRHVDDFKWGVIYYIFLQVLNDQYESTRSNFTRELFDTPFFLERVFSAPQALFDSLMHYFKSCEVLEERRALFQLLTQFISIWNCHFIYELILVLWCWEDTFFPSSALLSELPPTETKIQVESVGEKPERLEPRTVYTYVVEEQCYYAYKTWTGADVVDQMLGEAFVAERMRDPKYWANLQVPPIVAYLTDKQAKIIADCQQEMISQFEGMTIAVPHGKRAYETVIQQLQDVFYQNNFLIQQFAEYLEQLEHQIFAIQQEDHLQTKIGTFVHYHQQHVRLQQILNQLLNNQAYMKSKPGSIFPAVSESLSREIKTVEKHVRDYQQAYENFKDRKQSIFLKMTYFPFVVKQTRPLRHIKQYGFWGVSLGSSAILGMIVLGEAQMPSAALLSLYLSFVFVFLTGSYLGWRALMETWSYYRHPKICDISPGWNGPRTK